MLPGLSLGPAKAGAGGATTCGGGGGFGASTTGGGSSGTPMMAVRSPVWRNAKGEKGVFGSAVFTDSARAGAGLEGAAT